MKRLPRITNLAKGQPCINCGAWNDTTVAAHMPYLGVADGGYKCLDLWTAHLCRDCHYEADHGQYRKDLHWRTRMVYQTLCRLVEQGHIK